MKPTAKAQMINAVSPSASCKICIAAQQKFTSHRCGWNYAIQALAPLHHPRGVLFDGFIESSFLWQSESNRAAAYCPPYRQPWVGFLHYPPNMPAWFLYHDSPQRLFQRDDWQASFEHCSGLFCLSDYQAQWLRELTGKPVSALVHPTEIPAVQFDFEKFVANPQKKIVQLGWWLRKLNAIYQLPIAVGNPLGYQKVRLMPVSGSAAIKQIRVLTQTERTVEGLTLNAAYVDNTAECDRLSNAAYDTLLSQNIAFALLHDTSANNAVIECIARATPLLINPLPAVVEYIGKDYPLYAQTLDEAADKAMDLARLHSAHQYLKTCSTRRKMSADAFRAQFQSSEVYRLL